MGAVAREACVRGVAVGSILPGLVSEGKEICLVLLQDSFGTSLSSALEIIALASVP